MANAVEVEVKRNPCLCIPKGLLFENLKCCTWHLSDKVTYLNDKGWCTFCLDGGRYDI